jgi:hypothetical protein
MLRPRGIAALALALASLLLSAGVALGAGNPGRTLVLPLPDALVGEFCGPELGEVTIAIDPDTYRAYVQQFTFADGTIKFQFNGWQGYTVEGNGTSIDINASGPGNLIFYPDGSVSATGQGHLLFTGPVGTSQQGIWLYTGKTTLDIVSNPYALVSGSDGHVTDLCAVLAAA